MTLGLGNKSSTLTLHLYIGSDLRGAYDSRNSINKGFFINKVTSKHGLFIVSQKNKSSIIIRIICWKYPINF